MAPGCQQASLLSLTLRQTLNLDLYSLLWPLQFACHVDGLCLANLDPSAWQPCMSSGRPEETTSHTLCW